MDNHLHLLVETPTSDLTCGMQRIHGEYAQAFNGRHKQSGHLFQGRFEAVPVDDDTQLWAVIRYIAQNPVEAGLCEEPETWPWSSHAAIVDGNVAAMARRVATVSYIGSDGGDLAESLCGAS